MCMKNKNIEAQVKFPDPYKKKSQLHSKHEEFPLELKFRVFR